MCRKYDTQLNEDLPRGELVENSTPAQPPGRKRYEGRYVDLSPVDPEKDVNALYRYSHGSEENIRLWTYMA
jgi:hypothetical protein